MKKFEITWPDGTVTIGQGDAKRDGDRLTIKNVVIDDKKESDIEMTVKGLNDGH